MIRYRTLAIDLDDTALDPAGGTIEHHVNAALTIIQNEGHTVLSVQLIALDLAYTSMGEPGDHRDYHHRDRGVIAGITYEEARVRPTAQRAHPLRTARTVERGKRFKLVP